MDKKLYPNYAKILKIIHKIFLRSNIPQPIPVHTSINSGNITLDIPYKCLRASEANKVSISSHIWITSTIFKQLMPTTTLFDDLFIGKYKR